MTIFSMWFLVGDEENLKSVFLCLLEIGMISNGVIKKSKTHIKLKNKKKVYILFIRSNENRELLEIWDFCGKKLEYLQRKLFWPSGDLKVGF